MLREVIRYRTATKVVFEVLHDSRLHAPYGTFIVKVGTDVVGRQLSYPDRDDCARMLARHLAGQALDAAAARARVANPAMPPSPPFTRLQESD